MLSACGAQTPPQASTPPAAEANKDTANSLPEPTADPQLIPLYDPAEVLGSLPRGRQDPFAPPPQALGVNLDYRNYSGIGQPRREEFLKPVKRSVVGPGRLEIFDVATSKWSAADSNRVELRLPPGGGVLVRVAP